MAQAALFLGWGENIPGREAKGLEVFNETLQYYGKLQQDGKIDSFEPVLLNPHGGDLDGFVLLKGDEAALNEIEAGEEFQRLIIRAGMVVRNVGVLRGSVGEGLGTLMGLYQQQIGDFA